MVDRTAIVTGAAMGYRKGGPSIGGAISVRLAEDGYRVVVVDLGEMGQKTVGQIEANGGEALFIQADVTKTEDVKRIVEAAEDTFGGVNCLVNCVARYGPGMAKSIMDISEEEWYSTLEVNLNGYFKMAKYTIPAMLKSGGGTIINLSSIESMIALPNFSIYSVSKAAIDGLTRSLAVDFAPRIRTNSICPGFVRIENSENQRTPEQLEAWLSEIATQYPMQRVCTVDEIADVASFLANDNSSFINGQSLVVDGGKSIADFHKF